MTLSELSQRIDTALDRIESEVEQQAAIAGSDLVALITNRVIQKGQNADGGNFSPYSTKEVPAFLFFNKSRNNSAEATVRKKAKKKEPISYKDFRELNNLNTNFKNFEFTGSMFRGFRLLKVEKTTTGVKITIGGSNPDSEKKIGWLSEQEGQSIIRPSSEEIAIVQKNLTAWVQGIINKI